MSKQNGFIEEKKIFLEIASYLNKGDAKQALDLLSVNKDALFAFDPLKTLRANFELRILLNQYDEAYEDYAYFSNLPYVSQEVEETLREIPKALRANELASRTTCAFNEEEAHAALSDGEDPLAILGVLQGLRNHDITPFLEEIRDLLTSDIHEDVKTFALLLLVDKSLNEDILFKKEDAIIKINPSKLGNPYQSKSYLEIRLMLEKEKDISIASVSLELLDRAFLVAYPFSPFLEDKNDDVIVALKAIASSYLGADALALTPFQETLKKKIEGYLSKPSLM